jgi:hypothetical protein
MNPTYEILIKLEADLQGGKDVTQALKEAKTAATDLGGRYDTTRTKTDALNQSKQRLRDTIKGLSFQIPVLGSLLEKFSSGLGGAVALAVGAYVLIKRELDAFEKALGDSVEDKRFETAVEAKKRALGELKEEMRRFREEVEEFSGDPNDPQRLAKQRIAAAEAEARRQGEQDQAAVGAGKMTQAQAADRATMRAMNLAAFKDSTRENEVANTSIQRNMALLEADKLSAQLAGMPDQKTRDSQLAAKEAQIEKAKKRMDDADEWLNGPWAKALKSTSYYRDIVTQRDGAQSDIDMFTTQLGEMKERHKLEGGNYAALESRRNRLKARAARLDQIGEEDVLSRPFEREQSNRDRLSTASAIVRNGDPNSPAVKAALSEMNAIIAQAVRENNGTLRQLLKIQRNP